MTRAHTTLAPPVTSNQQSAPRTPKVERREHDSPHATSQKTLSSLALALLVLRQQHLVDVRAHTTTGNGGLDESVELLVATDGELQVTRVDALDLEVLGRVAGQLQHLSSQVLEDGSSVHGGGGANTLLGGRAPLEVAVDTADRELEPSARRARLRLLLCRGGLATLAALALAACTRTVTPRIITISIATTNDTITTTKRTVGEKINQ